MSLNDVLWAFLTTPIVAGSLLLGVAGASFGGLFILVRKMTFKP